MKESENRCKVCYEPVNFNTKTPDYYWVVVETQLLLVAIIINMNIQWLSLMQKLKFVTCTRFRSIVNLQSSTNGQKSLSDLSKAIALELVHRWTKKITHLKD